MFNTIKMDSKPFRVNWAKLQFKPWARKTNNGMRLNMAKKE